MTYKGFVDLSDYVKVDIEGNIVPEYLAQLYDLTETIDRVLPDYRVTLEVWGTEVKLVFTKLKEG